MESTSWNAREPGVFLCHPGASYLGNTAELKVLGSPAECNESPASAGSIDLVCPAVYHLLKIHLSSVHRYSPSGGQAVFSTGEAGDS